MDKLRAMQAFVAIADHGSLTAAARVLDSSLPAMVRTLAALEAHLGTRLAQRTTRRIALTDEGQRYLDTCRQVLAAVADGEAALSSASDDPAGHLTVTAPVQFGQMFVAPAVTRFVRAHPKMQVRLLLFDRVVNLLEEGIDVGIRIGDLADSSLVARQVASVRRMVVASPAFLRRAGVPKHPRDLLAANCVRFTGSSGPWWTFHEGKRTFNVPVTGNLEFNHVGPALDACLDDMGFGMFISYQVAGALAQKRLRVVLEAFEPPPRPISVVTPHARLLPARTRVFVEAMRRELALQP
jgi:DNA-binding transcriptional LysR family regulator